MGCRKHDINWTFAFHTTRETFWAVRGSVTTRGPTCCVMRPVAILVNYICTISLSQGPRGLRRRCKAARLLRLWVWIPPGAWMFVCCECRVLSGRGLCDELITRPEESYRLWCVVVCDLETLRMRRPWPALGRSATAKTKALASLYNSNNLTN